MFNTNLDILEPTAWIETYIANLYPNRPILARAATTIRGQSIDSQVAQRNKEVRVPRPAKPNGSKQYTGNGYTYDDPDVSDASLVMNNIWYDGFKVNKWDQKFSMVDLVNMYFQPYMEDLMNQINADMKDPIRQFEAAFGYLNGGNLTQIDDDDIRNAKRFLEKRKFLRSGAEGFIDADARYYLTGQPLFVNANQRGSLDVQISGEMGPAFGFRNFHVDPLGIVSPAVTFSGTASGTAAEGDKIVPIDDGAGGAATPGQPGDIVAIGSSPTQDDFYVIDETPTGGDNTANLYLKEPLRKAVANNDPIVGKAGQTQAFYDPSAIVLVTAGVEPLDTPNNGIRTATGFDPVNRVTFQVTVTQNDEGVKVLIESLYGYKNFMPDRGIRYEMGTTAKV